MQTQEIIKQSAVSSQQTAVGNQQTANSETQVRLVAGTILLPSTILSELKLPNILKMEIEHPLFKDSGKQIEVLNKIVRMLAVQFQSEDERKISGGEWVAFVQKYELTAPEIIEAYTMALRKELNPNGEPIKIFPNLSLITAGEILKAYQEFKRENILYQKGKDALRDAVGSQRSAVSSQQVAENRQKLREILEKQTEQGQICRHGHLFYDEFSQNDDFPDLKQTAKEKWEVIFEVIKKLITAHKMNRNSLFSAKELKDIEFIISQGFEAFLVQRNSPTLTKIKADIMSKNSFYFSHDGNARNDEKLLAVRMRLGAEGYGIYFMLLERLLECDNYILRKDYNLIAFDLRVSSHKIKSVIEDFGLFHFTEDGERFYSEGLLKRMKPLDALRQQRSQAGKVSAEKRKAVGGGTYTPLAEIPTTVATTVQRPLPKNSTKESKVNVLLEKEPKEKNIIKKSENDFLKAEDIGQQAIEIQEEEKEKIAPQPPKKEKFSPPTLEEITAYCTQRQNNINAEVFFNFYQSKGWMVGKNKMKDWKAAIHTWEQKQKENGQSFNSTGNTTGNRFGSTDRQFAYAPSQPATTRKISAREILANRNAEQFTQYTENQSVTIEVETSTE